MRVENRIVKTTSLRNEKHNTPLGKQLWGKYKSLAVSLAVAISASGGIWFMLRQIINMQNVYSNSPSQSSDIDY